MCWALNSLNPILQRGQCVQLTSFLVALVGVGCQNSALQAVTPLPRAPDDRHFISVVTELEASRLWQR